MLGAGGVIAPLPTSGAAERPAVAVFATPVSPSAPMPQDGSRPAKSYPVCRPDLSTPPVIPGQPAGLLGGWEGMHQEHTWELPQCEFGCELHDRVPDVHGAVGNSKIIAVTNRRVACHDKNGNALWGPIPLLQFFPWGYGSVFDPRAYYDRDTQRFFVLCLDTRTAQSFLNLAVSKTAEPATGTSSDWYFHQIEITEPYGSWYYGGDYPCVGSDSRGLYITFNMGLLPLGSGGILNCQILVFSKADLCAGTATPARLYTPPSGVGSSFTLQPARVITGPGPGNVAYFAEVPRFACNFVRLWAVSDPIGAPVLSSPAVVSIPCNGGEPMEGNGYEIALARMCGVHTREGSLTPIAPRAMDAVWADGKVWLCHTAGGGAQPLRSIVYYYAVQTNGFPAAAPALAESGTFDGGGGEYGIWHYMPALGVNALDDLCITFTRSSYAPPVCPTIMVATRRAGDGRFGAPWPVKTSPTSGLMNLSRWGDFGVVCPDPTDDTFWVCHEWIPSMASRDWSTWWAHLEPTVRTDAEVTEPAAIDDLDLFVPNPCVSGSILRYRLTARRHVRLVLLDVTGRCVETLVDRIDDPGRHSATLGGQNLPSGVYFCILTAGATKATQRAVLLR